MAVSQTSKYLWGTGFILVIFLLHLNLGLLSDYKICGNSGCESPMSRVQAIRDYHGKDCRFLSFKKGDTIYIYHKLTGKREDLWAGSIDKQFGYFPKDAVQEEHVQAATEKVLATQESDFFCMDENGYVIDSSHLDSNDDEKIPNHNSKATQSPPYTDDTNAESPSGSVPADFPVSAQEADSTLTQDDESKNAVDAAAGTREEVQGGSASAPWLRSSVTGWLGLTLMEEPGTHTRGEKKDERKEIQAESSFASSVTGWLGLGGQGKIDNAVKKKEAERETDDFLASTMIGWLGFGGKERTDQSAKKEKKEERDSDEEQQPAENFISRRMSLDLEGNRLREEENKGMGMLDWLGNGLSDRLGFGLGNQESGHVAPTMREEEERSKQEETPPSWFDMGIRDILRFSKEKSGIDESTGSGFKEAKEDETLEQTAGSENVNALTEEVKTEISIESKVEESPKSQSVPSEVELVPGSTVPMTADTDSSKDSVSIEGAGQEDISPQSKSDGNSQAVGGITSVVNSLFQLGSEEEEEDVLHDNKNEMKILDGEGSAEMEKGDHQISTLIEDLGSNTFQGFLTQFDNSIDEDGKREIEETAEIPYQTYNTDTSVKIGASSGNHESEGNDEERDLPRKEIVTWQTDESAERVGGSTETQPVMSSGKAEEDKTLTPYSEETSADRSDFLSITDNTTEAETHEEADVHLVEGSPLEIRSSHLTSQSTVSVSEDVSEEDKTPTYTSDSTTQVEDDADQNSASPHMELTDAHMLKETENNAKEHLQPAQTETTKLKKEILMTEAEKVEQEKTEKIKGEEEVNTLDKQQEVEEEKQVEVVLSKGEEILQEAEENNEEEKPEDIHVVKKEEKQEAVEGINAIEKQEEETEDKETQGEEEKVKKEIQEEEVGQFKEEDTPEVEEEEKMGDEKKLQLSHHFNAEVENNIHSLPHHQKDPEREGQSERSPETFTQTDKRDTEDPEIDKEEREGEKRQEIEVGEAQENVEGKRRDTEEEEEGMPKCSNELCPQANIDRVVKDRDANDSETKWSSTDEEELEAGVQIPATDTDEAVADGIGVSHAVPLEGVDGGDDRKQEEEQSRDDVGGDEGKEEQQSNVTENEDIPDPNVLGVNQARKSDLKDLLHSALDKDDQLYPSGAQSTDLSYDNTQGDKTKPGDTESSSIGISSEIQTQQIHSDHETHTEDTGDVRASEDVPVTNGDSDDDTVSSEFRAEAGSEISGSFSDPVESQPLISDMAVPHVPLHPVGSSLQSDDYNKGTSETESGKAFGLFKGTFKFFSQGAAAESAPSLESNAGETSRPQGSMTPEQHLDSDSTQSLHTDPHIAPLQQQPQPSPPPFTPSPSPSHSHLSSLQTKTLSKHYKSLLVHMSLDETAVLLELFGRHKLQFLDYILGNPETVAEEHNNDIAILLDIERLLHYHREALLAPSVKLADAPEEDQEKTKAILTLEKLQMLLGRVKGTFSTGQSYISNTNHQAEAMSVCESCSARSKDNKVASEEVPSMWGASSTGLDSSTPRHECTGIFKEKDGQPNGCTKERGIEDRKSPPSPEGAMKQILDFVDWTTEEWTTHIHAVREFIIWLSVQVVSALPDDIRPGPDLYGVPWEPVIITSLVGLMTMLLFTCRCYSSVKSRMYRSKERWMAEQVAQLLDEKCKVLETLSKCQQEHDDLESSLRDSGVLAQTQKTELLEGKITQLGHDKTELKRDLEQLKYQLDQQRENRREQERKIAVLEESIKTIEEETKDLQSQDEQAQTTLKVYNMNSDRLQRNLERAKEENTLVQESNAQLRQQVEGWEERVSELEAGMSRCEVAHSVMVQDVANKDERIMSMTDRLLRMKAWDSDLEEEERLQCGEKETSNGTPETGEKNGREDKMDTQNHLQKVQKLIYAAKLNADLKSVDEDKDRVFAKLNDEVKAKEDLLVSIKQLESEKLSLHSDAEKYSDQVQRLQQKLHIMTEMYQENELKLHRLLTVEEKERLQKEEKLNKADKNIALAMEELNNYRQRAAEMEEELNKTKHSYQTQISEHEKKAHNNWLAARAADRELTDIRRENALLRQKLTDTQFKLDTLDKDPFALDSLTRPMPFRVEKSPYGPSPLGRPASETRAFLSSPTLMDGPTRLSPRAPRGAGEPPGGHGEIERSGGPHSDSGSSSPTWDRDRRGPQLGLPGPLPPPGPGYLFPEPGGPIYRRPLLPPGVLGLMPTPGPVHPRSLPPGPPHPAHMADGSYRETSVGPGEQEHRESGPGDQRTPPEADPKIGGAPPPGPPIGPMDGPFPRRAPYGPAPPDFYPPRVPPMMPMWVPPRPGMLFPPRVPPGGLPLPPTSHHPLPMRPPLPEGLPPPSMGPLPPHQSL